MSTISWPLLVGTHLDASEVATAWDIPVLPGSDLRASSLAVPDRPQIVPRRRRRRARRPTSLVERHLAEGRPLVAPAGNPSAGYRALKRGLDIAGALVLLALLGPLMLAIYLVLLVTTRGKPLFWQVRAGYLGRPFRMAKFRTMRLDAERVKAAVANQAAGPVFKNRRDPRVTRLGWWLRKTSLDETPQVFHVLWGQMSLVGPRPLDVREVARFAAWQRRRLAVVPGLTCLWQVSGRSDVGFEDWVRMDLRYVRTQGLWTDCKLLLRTPWSVLCCRGAY
jgi:lipopolysaccharide/colanic/teichoic acid biosynthesis glycosyltransferase